MEGDKQHMFSFAGLRVWLLTWCKGDCALEPGF